MTGENEINGAENENVPVDKSIAEGQTAQDMETQADAKDAGANGTEKLLAEFRELEKNYEGLRKKLAATEKQRPVTAEDLAEELQGLESEEDKQFAGKFVEMLSKVGVDKKAAKELLHGIGELYKPEDPKEFYQKEMEKLGPKGKELVGELKQFYAAMKEQRDWTPEDFAALEAVTQTADGVRLVSKVLRSADRMKAGQFSTYTAQKESAENLTNRDRIGMYERAYAMQRTNPEEARQELKPGADV
jgi:hypothetical protein